jgi:hypothetical protein
MAKKPAPKSGGGTKPLIIGGVLIVLALVAIWLNWPASDEGPPPLPPAASESVEGSPAAPQQAQIIGDDPVPQIEGGAATPNQPTEDGKPRAAPKGTISEPAAEFTEGKVG